MTTLRYRQFDLLRLGMVLAIAVALAYATLPVAAAEPVNPQASNVGSQSFVVSWITATSEVGQVIYGPGTGCNNLTSRADDVRGSGYSGLSHYVKVAGLDQNADYCYRIVSGGTQEDTTRQVRTAPVLSSLPMPSSPLHGTVKDASGNLITAAIVYIKIKHSSDLAESALLATYTDKGGWAMVLENARDASGQVFSATDTDLAVISVEAGVDNKTNSPVTVTIGDAKAGVGNANIVLPIPATPTPPPTNTPVPPTNTPVPPTNTPPPTDTSVPPVDTQVPGNTAVPPASTSVPAETGQPTGTPVSAANVPPPAAPVGGGPPATPDVLATVAALLPTAQPAAPAAGGAPVGNPINAPVAANPAIPPVAQGNPVAAPPAAAGAAPPAAANQPPNVSKPAGTMVAQAGLDPTAIAGSSAAQPAQAAAIATPASDAGGGLDVLQGTVAVAGIGIVVLILVAGWGMARNWRG